MSSSMVQSLSAAGAAEAEAEGTVSLETTGAAEEAAGVGVAAEEAATVGVAALVDEAPAAGLVAVGLEALG